MAKVVAVNISKKKGLIKKPVESVHLVEKLGIEGDAHAGNWHRQVSLLDQASVDKMTALGVEGLTPGIFAENITTEGVVLHALPIGTRLRVGETELEVTQIGKECHAHCQVYQQVGMCIMPTEGIFTIVIRGGEIRAGDAIEVLNGVRAAVITLSDKGAAGLREDKSGPALVEALRGHALVTEHFVIPDEFEQIKAELCRLADSGNLDLILTTGGTGLAPRDVTPEATLAVVERLVPGIPEAMRAESRKITERAMLSRAQAGVRGRTLIVNLPGSPKGAVECLQVFLPVLAHAVETLRGEAYECARP
ncbi:MAG: MOSC domain-containing protein [Chloroflexi bacterium]|nr:MOSC domain-containing protein [Chloroflexota bacterium]